MQELREVTTENELPAEPSESKPVLGKTARAMLWVAALGIGVFLLAWNADAEARALRGLPEGERHALYARTLENLNTVCATGATSMREFCEEQARLAMAFPECDDQCYAIAEKQVSRVQPPR